uniref:Uncharacterized protein n=1 Tax=Oryza brachyantha TaxID=4533 RepID=J3N5I9_ORYBR
MDSSGNGTSRLFNIDYYGQHTCRGDGMANPYVVETIHHSTESIIKPNAITLHLNTKAMEFERKI